MGEPNQNYQFQTFIQQFQGLMVSHSRLLSYLQEMKYKNEEIESRIEYLGGIIKYYFWGILIIEIIGLFT